MSEKQILAKLKRKNKTASELSLPTHRLYALERKGLVVRAGNAQTKKRGRPAVIWAVA